MRLRLVTWLRALAHLCGCARTDVARAERPAFTPEKIERLEAGLLPLPQVEMPLTHRFAPGVYLREIFMPAGTFVIGHQHKTEHFNVVLSGRARVSVDGGQAQEIVAPCVFTSGVGVRKVLYILEDMRWATVHPTKLTDVDKLERKLITKSAAFHAKELADMDAQDALQIGGVR